MSKNKTKPTQNSAIEFIRNVSNEERRKDAFQLLDIFENLSGCKAVLWGESIIGFDSYHYKYESGREGDMCLVGFSPRKDKLSIYIMPGFVHFKEELSRLGKHKLGKACLYINRLTDVDIEVLKSIIAGSISIMRKKYH